MCQSNGIYFIDSVQTWLTDIVDSYCSEPNILFKVNQMTSKQSLHQRFRAISSKRQYDGMQMGKNLSELLAFMDSVIKKEFESFTLLSFSICGGERRHKVNPQFESAFLTLSVEERIEYFELAVNAVTDTEKLTNNSIAQSDLVNYEVLPIKVIKGLKPGPSYKIRLSEYMIDCSHYQISLSGYLLRRSKKNQKIFILESFIKQDPSTIRFELVEYSTLKDQALLARSNRSFIKYILDMRQPEDAFPEEKASRVRLAKDRSPSPIKGTSMSIDIQCKSQLSAQEYNPDERSVIQDIMHNEDGAQDEQIYDLVDRTNFQFSQKPESRKKYQKNVAQIILPQISLGDVENLNDYLPVVQDESHRLYIYQHCSHKAQYVMELYLRHGVEAVVRQLCEVQNYKLWNKCINESHVKLSISSDNAYLVYMKQRALNQWFRERDFLFLRHLCKVASAYYLVDCSIENLHFIPFLSIIRGVIRHCITRIEPSGTNECRIIMKIDIEYGGLLTNEGSQELALKFLQEFVGLESFISRFKGDFKCSYNLSWEIYLSNEQLYSSQSQSRQLMSSSSLFNQPLEPLSVENDDDEFYSIQDDQQRQPVYEISKEELAMKKRKAAEISYLEEKIELNEEGLVVLPSTYLSIKHEVNPIKIEPRRKKLPYDNLMLKNDFRLDKSGGLILVNESKIAAQDNVIKFMMSTLKKNFFSGKGILNISLPVEIFNCDSNLQRLCETLALAPEVIEKQACKANPVDRFKWCIAFAFTNSVLYFDIEKPFNPILGETFQGFIDGCPVYAEQVSHHPPISSIYFIGRGYKIYGNLEAKVYVHLNSGDGINEGFYTIEFDDGTKVVFQTCPGEISGLAMGDRKFRFKGKTFIVDSKNRLFCAINFEDSSGIFSKSKWQFCDQMDGQIVRVTESFIRSFFESKQGKDAICPGKKDIQQRLGHLGGRWIDSLLIDGKEYYNVKQKPYDMIHYEYPLNSNSNYREDLIYRKLNDLSRSQSQKERLEVFQRNDRKLREKYHPNKH